MCDLNLLRSMSEKIRSHYKYLRYDRDGKPLFEIERVPSGAKIEDFPEFLLQLRAMSGYTITEENVFYFVPWHAYMEVKEGVARCDEVLTEMIRDQWIAIRMNTDLNNFLILLGDFFDTADCATTFHCERASVEVNKVLRKWQKSKAQRLVGSGLSVEHWSFLFELASRDVAIEKTVRRWVNSINAEVPKELLGFDNPILPYLTMTNLRSRVGFEGVMKMEERGVRNQTALVEKLLEPDALLRWGISGHNVVLNSYGPQEVDEVDDGDDSAEDISGDMSREVNSIRDKLARRIDGWN